MSTSRTTRLLIAALVAVSTISLLPLVAPTHAHAGQDLPTVPHLADPDVGRQPAPEDEYAMALGCYELTSAATGRVLGRDGAGYADGAGTPFRFEPTALGRYLLVDPAGDVVAARGGPVEALGALVEDVEYVLPVDTDTELPGSLADNLPVPLDIRTGDLLPTLDTHLGGVAPGAASPSADWRARWNGDGTLTFTLDAASGRALAVVGGRTRLVTDTRAREAAFRLASVDEARCGTWPEIPLGVDGPILAGETPWDEVRGTIDGHLHLMAFEFLGGDLRCGQPWHPYGVEQALRDCVQNEALGGRIQEALLGEGPGGFGGDELWPSFTVPTSGTLTYEQVYHRWLERAWRGGLRMMTVLMVENNALCEVWPQKRNTCDEMDSIRLQIQRLHQFVDYLDARAGGPGEGWAQIVTDPFEARRVINSGRLALVMGIETSVIFDCRELLGVSQCTDAQMIAQLDEVHDLGIRQIQLVNKFDNALSGVKGDAGTTGVIVNGGNLLDTGHLWRMETCPEDRDFGTDRTQLNLIDDGAAGTPVEEPARDVLAGLVLDVAGVTGVAPAYPAGPHCNIAGLTDQGARLLAEIADRGMIFDPDHMSARAAQEALDVMDEIGHHGLISSHGWADPIVYERIYDLGGTVTPYAGGAEGFVAEWRRATREWIHDDYYFGFGYGADTNGLGGQGAPREPAAGEGVDYPFTAPGGAVVDRQVSGTREPYDIDVDGVAHYGLYPDWLEDLHALAGDQITTDMLRGPEAYLQMWERALGVPRDACGFGVGADTGGVDASDGLAVGMTVEEAVRRAGQPRVRDAEGYTWCGEGPGGRPVHVRAAFDAEGRVARVEERPAAGAHLPPVNPPRVGSTEGLEHFVRPAHAH